jgi:hypothetical protein
LVAVVCLTIVLALSNGFYILWVTTLTIDTFKNERGSLRRWKNMNDEELLNDLLKPTFLDNGSTIEREGFTILEEGPSETQDR